ncbi:MAG: PorT family protein [Alistipes sp.]|nr:PorT family protein [Alistipes sp.]
MKKFLSLFTFALFAFSAVTSAQNLRFGVTGAMNVANYSMSADGISFDADSRIGFKAGFQMEIDAPFIYDGFYFDTGALISAKGAKMSTTVGDVNVEWTSRPYYLEVPMHIGYSYSLNSSGSVQFFGSFGPYIAVGLWGTDKVTMAEESTKPDTFASDGIKRFDFGLGLKGGLRLFDHYRIFVGYDWGLINVAQDDDSKMNNRNFYVGASYLF